MQAALQFLSKLQSKIYTAAGDNVEEEKKETDFAANNNASSGFQNDLLRSMYEGSGDNSSMVLSAFSILTAMTVCMLGTAQDTLQQMLNVLYPNAAAANKQLTFENSAQLTADIMALCKYYNETYDGSDDNVLICVANKLWINHSYNILSKYLGACKVDAVAQFNRNDAVKAAQMVNEWCAQCTHQMITELVDEGVMRNAQLVIANAIYFKGKFVQPFNPKLTVANVAFYADHRHDVQLSTVNMMHMEAVLQHAMQVNSVYDVFKMPYKTDQKLSLMIAIDKHSEKNSEVRLLTTQDLTNVQWQKQDIEVWLPRFKFSTTVTLNSVLQNMGITDAFDATKADFSNMSDANDLYIDTVIHKAVIDVDEEGTEAAAATGIGVTSLSFKPQIRCDHTFQFFVFDDVKKVALFSGIFAGK